MRTFRTLLFATVILMAWGCVDMPKYDLTPAIKFVGIDKYDANDSLGNQITNVRITLSFEDGDGDLGESLKDNAAREDYLKENGGWGNYQTQVLKLEKDKWVNYDLPLLSFLVFPVLKTDGTRGPIRGKLDYDISFPNSRQGKLTPLKFLVKIRDRELRESNIIETDSISVPIYDAEL